MARLVFPLALNKSGHFSRFRETTGLSLIENKFAIYTNLKYSAIASNKFGLHAEGLFQLCSQTGCTRLIVSDKAVLDTDFFHDSLPNQTWWADQDLNLEPTNYEFAALTN